MSEIRVNAIFKRMIFTFCGSRDGIECRTKLWQQCKVPEFKIKVLLFLKKDLTV